MLSEKIKKEFVFFRSLSDNEISDFISFCENKQVPAEEILWHEGEKDNYAVFILSGKMGIKKKTEFEGKHMIVGTFGKGTVAGELCLLTDHARSVTAEILEPAELMILTNKNFEGLITKNPMLGLKLLRHIFIITSKRLNKSYDRIASMF